MRSGEKENSELPQQPRQKNRNRKPSNHPYADLQEGTVAGDVCVIYLK